MKRKHAGPLLALSVLMVVLSIANQPPIQAQDTGWTDGSWEEFNEYLAEHGTDDPPLTGDAFVDFVANKEADGELSEGTTASAMVEMSLGYHIPDIVHGINIYEDMLGDGVAPEEPE